MAVTSLPPCIARKNTVSDSEPFQSVNSVGTAVTGRAAEQVQRLGPQFGEAGQGGWFSHPRWMSHLASNRHHDLPGERRTTRTRPADGGTRVPANYQTLRSDKGRDYT